MRQLTGELPFDHVRFELRDATMPCAPASDGSGLTASLGNAAPRRLPCAPAASRGA